MPEIGLQGPWQSDNSVAEAVTRVRHLLTRRCADRRARRQNLTPFIPRRSPPRPPAAPQDHIPLDLRKKQTRAIRHSLTKAEKAMKTQKQAKKLKHFPQRKYAVKA